MINSPLIVGKTHYHGHSRVTTGKKNQGDISDCRAFFSEQDSTINTSETCKREGITKNRPPITMAIPVLTQCYHSGHGGLLKAVGGIPVGI